MQPSTTKEPTVKESATREFTARVFRNGRNQAIRIPVELSFDTDTVIIAKQGEALIVRPKGGASWDAFFDDPSLVLPEDFSLADDLPPQDREPL